MITYLKYEYYLYIMLTYLANDIFKLIINILPLNDVINVRITNKENKELTKLYISSYLVLIKKSIKITLNIFPNIKLISIRNNNYITDDDFQYLNNIENLNMSNCYQREITDNCFHHLTKIKELNLLGCNQNWFIGNHFTDISFDYLSELETLHIDDNHVITNNGLGKIKKIKHLFIYNCSKITDNGISNLINLQRLCLYMVNITDSVFEKLNKIQELSLNDCRITDNGLKYLSSLSKLQLINVKNITCKDLNKLNVKELYLFDLNITDDDFKYLNNIKLLILYYLKINGSGLKYLTNIERLEINETPIIDEQINNLYNLIKLKEIYISRCFCISENKMNQLKEKFGNKLFYSNYN